MGLGAVAVLARFEAVFHSADVPLDVVEQMLAGLEDTRARLASFEGHLPSDARSKAADLAVIVDRAIDLARMRLQPMGDA